MFGHSLGGSTTAQGMRVDQRVRAGVLMDSPVPSATRQARFDRPILLIRSDDKTIAQLVGPAWQQFLPQLSRWHRTLKLVGSGHNDFTDLTVVAHHLALQATLRSSWSLGTIEAREAVRRERAYLVVFFDQELRGRP